MVNKMKYMKKIILFLGLIIIIIVASGCMQKEENIYDRMLRYIQEKYPDDKFTIDGPFGGGPGITSKEMFVFSEKYPEYQITVGYYQDDGEEYFTDNYLQYKYKKETEEYLSNMVWDLFNVESIISYSIGSLGNVNGFTSETTFEEFIVSPRAGIGFTAIIHYEYELNDIESLVEEIKKYITENSLVMNVSIYFSNGADTYKEYMKLSDDELDRMHRIRITMNRDKEFVQCKWW